VIVRTTRNLLILVALAVLAGCSSAPHYTVKKFSSGREIKILGMGPIRLGNGTTTLMFNYQTDLDISNIEGLKAEADDIWSVLKYDVAKNNFDSAVISAHDVPKGFLIKNGHSYNFVYEKGADGNWHRLEK
jgi:hypothetical protein